MSSFNYLPKHDVKSQFIIFHFQIPIILSTHKRKQDMKSPRDFLLSFQSPAETFSIISTKIGFLQYTHREYYSNFPFNFFKWKSEICRVPNCEWCSLYPFLYISSLLFIIPSVSVIKWSNLDFHLSIHLPIHPPALVLQRDWFCL